MGESPSSILSRAADLIRDAATAATPGPWEIEYDFHGKNEQGVFRMDPEHPDDPDYSVGLCAMDAPADNRWIALLNPAVAPALEQWLRETASRASVTGLVNGGGQAAARYAESRYGAALTFARVILGEEP